MLRRVCPHPVLSAFIVLVWLLLANSLSFGALLVGIVLALVIPPVTSRFWDVWPRFRRPAVLLHLVPRVLLDILLANLSVAWIVISRRNRSLRPAFLEIPLRIREPYAVVTLASIITLTPGTVSVLLSEDRGTLYVHALDCPDPEAAIREIRERYEGPLGELLE